MNSSAFCTWSLSKEWTYIRRKSLYSSHLEASSHTRTTHSITPNSSNYMRLNVTLSHYGAIRLGLNIHSTSTCGHKSYAGHLTDDRKMQPVPSRSS